jgi:microcystin-dependent protein
MVAHKYSDTAVETTSLTSGISSSATQIQVASVTGFPSTFPYYLDIDYGSVTLEVVEVTGGVGTTLDVNRGVSTTSPVSHSSGAVVRHVAPAEFYEQTEAHTNATSGVHGVTGNLVGATGAQELEDKTIDGNKNTLSNIPQSAVTDLESDLDAITAMIAPIGSILMWPTGTAPTGWLICNGSTFNATTYPELNALLGGNTLPDLRDRVPVGVSGTKAELSTGGAASVTLSSANLPSHSHTFSGTSSSAGGHSHSLNSLMKTNNAAGSGASDNGGNSTVQGTTTGRFSGGQDGSTDSVANHTHTYSGTTSNTGSGSSFSVQNPYVALNFIIRAA